MLITLGLSGLHIHSSPVILPAADVPEPPFPSPPFPGSKVQRRKKRQVWFHRGVFKLTESAVYGCLFLHSQCHIIFMCNFQKDRSGLGFQIHIDFPLSHFTFLWQDRTRVWIELCLTSQLFCSQAPHVPRNVEDETKYVELMVINDHLMVSCSLHVHPDNCSSLFPEFYFMHTFYRMLSSLLLWIN